MSNFEKLKKNEVEKNRLEDMDIETDMDFSVTNLKTGQLGYVETNGEKVTFIVPDEGMTEYYFSIEEFNRDFIIRD
ncbi:hypothetical protein AAGG74_16460 [Bacillus mexicanus]|uniref:hypothetical protein n=1 Tax=Bacillus mexicanus TaxID=2834415 RepID=UPI003D251207